MIVKESVCDIEKESVCDSRKVEEGGRRKQLVLGVPSVVTVNPTSGLFCVLYWKTLL